MLSIQTTGINIGLCKINESKFSVTKTTFCRFDQSSAGLLSLLKTTLPSGNNSPEPHLKNLSCPFKMNEIGEPTYPKVFCITMPLNEMKKEMTVLIKLDYQQCQLL